MTFLTRLFGRRSAATAAVPGPIAQSSPAPERDWDPWFRSHYQGAAARDEVPEHEKDTLYRDHSFEELKRYLLGEYRSLNRITADELIRSVSAAGFDIADTRLIEPGGVEPDASLLQQYPRELLLTNQIVITARRLDPQC